MKDHNEALKCIGCGAYVQTESPHLEGYLPSSAMKKAEDGGEVYCQRCFKLRHYNELVDVELNEASYKAILSEISTKQALLVLVVDLFDFEGTFIEGIQRAALDNPILLVANKLDLFPQSIKENRLRHWVMKRAHELGLRPDKIILTSARKGKNTQELMRSIEQMRKGKDVYVLGASNVGKSTLINQILLQATEEDSVITTSYFPGTTLGKIEIPLDDGSSLIDTPGIIQTGQVNYYLKGKDLKQVTPKKPLQPKVYQLHSRQTLFLGGLARFDFVHLPDQASVVVYMSGDVLIHRTKTEKATHIQESMFGKELTPSRVNEDGHETKRQSFKVKEKSDLLISGLAWVTVPADTTIEVTVSKEFALYLRPAMI